MPPAGISSIPETFRLRCAPLKVTTLFVTTPLILLANPVVKKTKQRGARNINRRKTQSYIFIHKDSY